MIGERISYIYKKFFKKIDFTRSQQRLRKHESTQLSLSHHPSNNNIVNGGPRESQQLEPIKPTKPKEDGKRSEWRITKMVLAIFLSFLACYLPITFIKVVDKNVDYPTAHICGYLFLYLSACLNPIIYVIMNKQYRQAYKGVLLCKNRMTSFTIDG